MAIEDHMKTDFTLSKYGSVKTDGRLVTGYTPDGFTYLGAVFTAGSAEVVVYASAEFVIVKNLYCRITVPLALGDEVQVDGSRFMVVSLLNTNNLNHHWRAGLTGKVD